MSQNSSYDTIRNHVRELPKQYVRYENSSKPVVMLKSNDDSRSKPANNSGGVGLANIPSMLANDNMPAHVYKDKRNTSQPGQPSVAQNAEGLMTYTWILVQ